MKTEIGTNNRYVAALVAAAGLAVPAAANAVESVTVSYRDLDLTRPEGIATLQGRLRAAARTVCGGSGREEVGARFSARRDCYEQSIAQAMRDLEADRQLVSSLRP
jgi:UrcA family protein